MPRKTAEPLTVDVFMPLLVSDWLTGRATFTMTNRQRGAFLQMLAHAWKQGATLPDDVAALAKYADEPAEWLQGADGALLLGQWPVVDDETDPAYGRRRNPKQHEVYLDAMARRERAHTAAVTGAAARWGKRPPAREPDMGGGDDADDVGDALAGVLATFPAVNAFGGAPLNMAALKRAAARVLAELSSASLPGFVSVVNAALVGMDGPQRTPDEVRRGLEDWCDNLGDLRKNAFRAYLSGARAPTTGTTGRRTAARTGAGTAGYIASTNTPDLAFE